LNASVPHELNSEAEKKQRARESEL